MTTYNVKSDVNKDYYFIEALTLRQGEKGHILQWEVYENGVQFANIGGYTINLRAETPSGKLIVQSGSFVSGSTVRINLPDAVTGEFGEFRRFYLEISSGTYKVTTPDIKVFVLPVADLTATAAQDYVDKVQQVIDEVLANYDEYVEMIDEAYLNELLQLQNAFTTAKGQLDKAVSDFKVQITNETNELSALITNLTNEVNQTVETINAALANMQTEINGLSDQVDGLSARMDEIVAEGAMTKKQADAAYMNIVAPPVNAQDWNTLTTIGTYSVEMATGANMPDPVDRWGTLLVQGKRHNDSMLTQLFISNNAVWFRRNSGVNTWIAWKKLGDDVDTSIYFRTWEDFVTDGRQFSEFYVQGSYAVLLMGEQIPTDSPVQEFDPPLTGWLEVNKIYNTGGSTTDLVMQKVYFPTLKKAFQRIQTNSVPEGQEANITWSDWASLGGAENATAEDVIIGERDDVVVTPKALAEATVGNTIFEEYFGEGGNLSEISSTATVPFGGSIGGSVNYQQNRPYTINSDNTLTFNKSGRFKFEGQIRFVPKDDATLGSDYAYTQLMVNSTGRDFISQGSARNGNTLKLTWVWSGFVVVDVQAGDTVKVQFTLRSGKTMFSVQMLNLQVTEVRSPDFPPIYTQPMLGDDPVIRQSDLNQLNLLSGILNLNIDSYIGTEGKMTGVVPNNSTLGFGSTKQSLRPSDNMTVRNSDGSITVNQSGNYLLFVQCWFQGGSTIDGYIYFNMMVNGARAGGQDRIFGAGSATLRNRYDGTGMYLRTLSAGDKLNVNVETSVTAGFSSLGAKAITIVKLS